MSEPIGTNLPSLEQVRRVYMTTLVFNNETHYTRQIYEVVINHSDNDSETEVWRSQPEVFWGLSKAAIISALTYQLDGTPFEEQYLLNDAIEQLGDL